jgi:hypothetical protein
MSAKAPDITFVAVGRVPQKSEGKPGKILAYHCRDPDPSREDHYTEVFRKLLAAGADKLKRGARQRLQWDDGAVCILLDQQGELLYCVYTALLTYPEPLAYHLLYDFNVAVQHQCGPDAAKEAQEMELNGKLQPKMKELVEQYEDPANFPSLQQNIGDVSSGGVPGPRRSGAAGTLQPVTGTQQNSYMRFAPFVVIGLILVIIIYMAIKMSKGKPSASDEGKAAAVLGEATSRIHSLFEHSAADLTKEHKALRGERLPSLV